MRMDVLVMENLFYQRKVKKVLYFDVYNHKKKKMKMKEKVNLKPIFI